MRVRIGISLAASVAPGEFESAIGPLEAAGVDSLWLPEAIFGPGSAPAGLRRVGLTAPRN